MILSNLGNLLMCSVIELKVRTGLPYKFVIDLSGTQLVIFVKKILTIIQMTSQPYLVLWIVIAFRNRLVWDGRKVVKKIPVVHVVV